ncbi:hypothetical protein DPMN_153835 [Dreissena polymorpha]|uniref:Uncharacterized protein n=1 Tax=Dreissena polymorpha TaxID=45954 RepID=A0A9D4FPL8_DREPO|nr:hypothetical protein DPMN_153835 [Dreissena polymorpha]
MSQWQGVVRITSGRQRRGCGCGDNLGRFRLQSVNAGSRYWWRWMMAASLWVLLWMCTGRRRARGG